MTDFAPDHVLGENVIPEVGKTMILQYSGTVVAGDFLEVSGVVAADNMLTVATQVGTDRAFAVAMYAGVSGDRRLCLIEGVTKITFGANVTVGAAMSVSGNKAINIAIIGNGLTNGTIISDGAADLDTGLVYFSGPFGGG